MPVYWLNPYPYRSEPHQNCRQFDLVKALFRESALEVVRQAAHRLPLRKLKVCPLCGAVNSRQNRSCFVCDWHGDFVSDRDHVERSLARLLDECPELLDILRQTYAPPSFLKLAAIRVLGRFKKRLDVRV